jgi:hypothetical protein
LFAVGAANQQETLAAKTQPVPKFIDPVSQKKQLENERFGLVFAKTGSINSGTDIIQLFRWQCDNQSIIISTAFGVGQGMGLLEYQAMPSLRDVAHDIRLCTFII